jgi:hypothetical protein
MEDDGVLEMNEDGHFDTAAAAAPAAADAPSYAAAASKPVAVGSAVDFPETDEERERKIREEEEDKTPARKKYFPFIFAVLVFCFVLFLFLLCVFLLFFVLCWIPYRLLYFVSFTQIFSYWQRR